VHPRWRGTCWIVSSHLNLRGLNGRHPHNKRGTTYLRDLDDVSDALIVLFASRVLTIVSLYGLQTDTVQPTSWYSYAADARYSDVIDRIPKLDSRIQIVTCATTLMLGTEYVLPPCKCSGIIVPYHD
jgi:hypothetical protein